MKSELLYRSFVDAMIQRCRHVPGGVTAESDGLVTAFTNINPASSYCFFSRPADSRPDFETRIAEAVTAGAFSRAVWSLGVLADWISPHDGYAKLPAKRGLDRRAVVYGMWSDALSRTERPSRPIDFRRVANDEELAMFAAINNAAHGLDPDAGPAIYRHYVHAPRSNAFIGFVDDEPVACAATFPTAHGVYLGGVATVAHQRGRGFGDAASRYALQFTMRESGLERGVLLASRDRTAFYERMGFAIGAELWLFRQSGDAR